MEKNKILVLTKILYVLFAISTAISLFIVYKDIRSAFRFVVAYVLFTFFMLLYVPLITFFNLRKFQWRKVRRIAVRFITLIILFSSINYILEYFFRSSGSNLYRAVFNALGLAFGISFFEVTFLKNKD